MTSTTASPNRPAQRWRLPLLVLLAVALIAASVWLGVLVLDRTDSDDGPVRVRAEQTTDDERVREDVMAATRQFVLNMGTYGPEDLDDKGKMPGYRDRVKPLLTTSFGTQFEEAITVAEQLVAKFAQKREADVYGVGVASFDNDSAKALIAGALTDSFGKGEQEDPRQFRWEVDLVKVDGDWLVDNYEPVGAATGQEAPQ